MSAQTPDEEYEAMLLLEALLESILLDDEDIDQVHDGSDPETGPALDTRHLLTDDASPPPNWDLDFDDLSAVELSDLIDLRAEDNHVLPSVSSVKTHKRAWAAVHRGVERAVDRSVQQLDDNLALLEQVYEEEVINARTLKRTPGAAGWVPFEDSASPLPQEHSNTVLGEPPLALDRDELGFTTGQRLRHADLPAAITAERLGSLGDRFRRMLNSVKAIINFHDAPVTVSIPSDELDRALQEDTTGPMTLWLYGQRHYVVLAHGYGTEVLNLEPVQPDQSIVAELPITFVAEAVARYATLHAQTLRCRATASELPRSIQVTSESLAAGEVILARDLHLPQEVEILSPGQVVASRSRSVDAGAQRHAEVVVVETTEAIDRGPARGTDDPRVKTLPACTDGPHDDGRAR